MSKNTLTVDQKFRAMEIALDWQAAKNPKFFLEVYIDVCELVSLNILEAKQLMRQREKVGK